MIGDEIFADIEVIDNVIGEYMNYEVYVKNDYITKFAKLGCYIGLDRLYNNTNEDYINKKLGVILTLCDFGYKDKIILSHDELFFNGFEANPQIKSNTRFDYVFKYILPRLEKEIADEIIRKNPIRMLKCQEG